MTLVIIISSYICRYCSAELTSVLLVFHFRTDSALMWNHLNILLLDAEQDCELLASGSSSVQVLYKITELCLSEFRLVLINLFIYLSSEFLCCQKDGETEKSHTYKTTK